MRDHRRANGSVRLRDRPGGALRVPGGRFQCAVSCLALAGVLAWSAPVAGAGNADLAKATQNPVASLISVPLQSNFEFGLGPEDASR
jgi:hypothetical protein